MNGKTKTDITLYTAGTPNGIKVSILLEELGLDYKMRGPPLDALPQAQVHPIKMMDNEQKERWFLEINPNGRIPDGEQLRVFESGAILEYLVDRYDQDHKVSYRSRRVPSLGEVAVQAPGAVGLWAGSKLLDDKVLSANDVGH
ncbi:hypothetical protein ACJZ2D_014723 [Fusarium nematophilum]